VRRVCRRLDFVCSAGQRAAHHGAERFHNRADMEPRRKGSNLWRLARFRQPFLSLARGNGPAAAAATGGNRRSIRFSPSVAPAGNRLAFSRRMQDDDVWRYRVGAAAEPLIVSSLTEKNPQFSPDGSRIAFESDRSEEGEEIWTALANGSKPVQMTSKLGRYQRSPRWSPDGRWIAFHSQGWDGQWDVYVIDASAGRPRRIAPKPSKNSAPSWSRDGKWIYFCSDRTGRFETWRTPFADGAAEQITDDGGFAAASPPTAQLFSIPRPSVRRCLRGPWPGAPSVSCWIGFRREPSLRWMTASTTSAGAAAMDNLLFSSFNSPVRPAGYLPTSMA
jgi:Tol biopolymer transport system component